MRIASLSLIDDKRVDPLSAEIIRAIIILNKRGYEFGVMDIVHSVSGRKSSVQNRMNLLEKYGYISRHREGRRRQVVVLRSNPKVVSIDLQSFMKECPGRKAEYDRIRRKKKKLSAASFEKAVALGKARDAEITSRRDGVFHDNQPLFRNGKLGACKIG